LSKRIFPDTLREPRLQGAPRTRGEIMPRYVMVVPSSAQPGRDDDYNAWYDGEHIHDICSLPGVLSGRRFVASDASPNPVPGRYLAIYEIETDDIGSVVAEMGRRAMAGEMSVTDALDRDSARIWFYEER
jgi:hypothetical protein